VKIDEDRRFRNEFIIPNIFEKFCARQNLSAPLHHVLEQTEFARQEVERSVAAPRCGIDEFEFERSYAKDIRGVRRTYGLGRGLLAPAATAPPAAIDKKPPPRRVDGRKPATRRRCI
jgi:hypothetical protein